MLILRRLAGQSVFVGNDVVITVLKIKGHTVRIGVNAPQDIEVHCGEIFERISRQREREPKSDVVVKASYVAEAIPVRARDFFV